MTTHTLTVNDAQPLWYWMNERHRIYTSRAAGEPWPWTGDRILRTYAFCNVFRELDRVTVWVRENIREAYRDHPALWFMLAIARTINWPPTLQQLMDEGGWPDETWDATRFAEILDERKAAGEKVYTGAYMIRAESDPSKDWYTWSKQEYIAHIVLGRLWEDRAVFDAMMSADTPTLQQTHAWLMQYHGWGPFMAYEVVTDLRHTRYLERAPDIRTWANAGPGALRGLNRLLKRDLSASIKVGDATALMRELMDLANIGAPFHSVLHPDLFHYTGTFAPLEMRDIEHSLCEMDKYLRVQTGLGEPRAKFTPPHLR